MRTRIHRSLRHALLVDDRHLESLADFLHSIYQQLEFTAGCCDGSQIVTNDVKELLAFENPSFRRIEGLDVQATSSFGNTANLSLQLGFSDTAQLTVTSDVDATAVHVAQELSSRVRDMRP